MSPKEIFKEFNKRFITTINKFKKNIEVVQEFQIQVYVNALPTPIYMFVK